jgi:glycyl-tRNA synthetase beta chain
MLNAALGDRSIEAVASPKQVRFKLSTLERLVDDVPFVQTATRPINIVAAAIKKDVPFGDRLSDEDRANLQSADGEELYTSATALEGLLEAAVVGENDEEAARLLLSLAVPINRFFDSTMVMAEEPEVRYARLTLLQMVTRLLLAPGDWSKIVIEG